MIARRLRVPPKKATKRGEYHLEQYITGEFYKFVRGTHYRTPDEDMQSYLYRFAKRYGVIVRVSIPEPGSLVFQFIDPEWSPPLSLSHLPKPVEKPSRLVDWQFKKWGDRDGYTDRKRPLNRRCRSSSSRRKG